MEKPQTPKSQIPGTPKKKPSFAIPRGICPMEGPIFRHRRRRRRRRRPPRRVEREPYKGNHSSSQLVHTIRSLRCHRRGGHVGGCLHVVHVTHESLRMKTEGFAH